MQIEVIQFVRPNGHKKSNELNIDDSLSSKVEEILSCGYYFSAEILSNDMLVFYISDDEKEMDHSMIVCKNDLSAISKLEKMIRDFDVKASLEYNPEDEE